MSSGFHSKKEGGGVLIAVSNHIESCRIQGYESDCEDIWVSLNINSKKGVNSETIYICGVYIPPPVQKHILKHFIDNTNRVLESFDGTSLVVGDFNLGNMLWSRTSHTYVGNSNSALHNMLSDFSSLHDLKQYNFIVNNKNKILDLVLSNKPQIDVCECMDPLISVDVSHPPLTFILETGQRPDLLPDISTNKYCFGKADYVKIQQELKTTPWDDLLGKCGSVNAMVAIFYDQLHILIRKYVPLSKPKNRKYPFWFSRSLINCIKEKYKCRMKIRKYCNPRDIMAFELLKKRCDRLLKESHAKYLENLEKSLRSNPKLFWTYLKKQKKCNFYPTKMKFNTSEATKGTDISNLFADYFSSVYTNVSSLSSSQPFPLTSYPNSCLSLITFTPEQILRVLKRLDSSKGAGMDGIPAIFVTSCPEELAKPLTYIINCSLRTGIYPSQWKDALVIPVYKNGDRSLISNYRPISIISVFAKIFELAVYPIFFSQFKANIAPEQHGFLKARSTTTNLTSFVEDLVEVMDAGNSVDAIYTDFSKAFDTVSHTLLIQKLEIIGVTGNMLTWCESYLQSRKSVVVINGYSSKSFISSSGVPQGSHLGPLFFNIFINDICSCFCNSKCLLYADDLKLYRTVRTELDAICLQNDLNNLVQWCRENCMSLNTSKCYVIKFSRKRTSFERNYSIDGNKLTEVEQIRDLGVILDTGLRFNLHIDDIVSRSFKILGFVLRNCKSFKNAETKISLFTALVRSVLEYGSIVWNPYFDIYKNRLENVQKRFLGHLTYSLNLAKKLQSYEERLSFFKLLSLQNRRRVLDNSFMFKLVNGSIESPYLLSKIMFRAPSRSFRASTYTPFVESFAHSRYGRLSPINRLIINYNSIYKIATSLHNNKKNENNPTVYPDIDIFNDNIICFKKKTIVYINYNL